VLHEKRDSRSLNGRHLLEALVADDISSVFAEVFVSFIESGEGEEN
jgi:hypothetical protein